MQTTSKVSSKLYRCTHCEQEHAVTTNHYGETYGRCPNGSCVSRRPTINATYQPPRHECLEPLPDGMARPEPWKATRLKDIVQ